MAVFSNTLLTAVHLLIFCVNKIFSYLQGTLKINSPAVCLFGLPHDEFAFVNQSANAVLICISATMPLTSPVDSSLGKFSFVTKSVYTVLGYISATMPLAAPIGLLIGEFSFVTKSVYTVLGYISATKPLTSPVGSSLGKFSLCLIW